MLNTDEVNFYLTIFKGLSFKDMYDLAVLAKTRKLSGGQVYIAEGPVYHKVAFIKSGLIRSYHLKGNGEEITLLLRWENQFIGSAETIVFEKHGRRVWY